eukprot:Tamp_17052.p1 GENE.Tamp_17052~~Tamp_17052.p1  ORF type:complete len:340 (+),score=65.06 Tamp_17052:1-1020(+)
MATDEASIQRELLAQLEELNRISMVAQAGPRRQMMNELAASPEAKQGSTASPASLMAQLDELNNLAGQVKTQTEAVKEHSYQSEEDREQVYVELKRLLDRREVLREKLRILEQRDKLKKKLKTLEEQQELERERERELRKREDADAGDGQTKPVSAVLECDIGFNVRDEDVDAMRRMFASVPEDELPAAVSTPPRTSLTKKASSLLKGLVPGLKSSPPSARNDSHTTGSPPATRRNSPAVNVSPATRRAVPNVTPQQASASSPAPAALESEVESLARQLAELDSLSSLGASVVPTRRAAPPAPVPAPVSDTTDSAATESKVEDLLGQLAALESLSPAPR